MKFIIPIIALSSIFFIVSCGGGGGSGGSHDGGGDGVATLTWTKPTENTDDSPLTDLEGFNIYYGSEADYLDNASSFQPNSLSVTNTAETDSALISCSNTGDGGMQCTITGLNDNENWHFAVTAVNSLRIESAPSEVVCKQFASSSCIGDISGFL